MKTIVSLSLLLAGSAAFAETPEKKPVDAYQHLSRNSPFTSDPVAPKPPTAPSVFDDWALGGVSEVEGGYIVTLVHKKNQGETQVIKPSGTIYSSKDEMVWIKPGDPKGFKVEKVQFDKNWKNTTVLISSGDKSATMKFDEKQMVPAAKPTQVAAQPTQVQPGQPAAHKSSQFVVPPDQWKKGKAR